MEEINYLNLLLSLVWCVIKFSIFFVVLRKEIIDVEMEI